MAALGSVCDAHNTVEQFLAHEINKGGGLTAAFGAEQYFVTSQIAVWVAVGDAEILAHEDSGDGLSWDASTSVTDSTRTAVFSSTRNLTLYASGGTSSERR